MELTGCPGVGSLGHILIPSFWRLAILPAMVGADHRRHQMFKGSSGIGTDARVHRRRLDHGAVGCNDPVEGVSPRNRRTIASIPVGSNRTYGAEFSPDDSKIYVTRIGGSPRIYQIDLSNKNKVTDLGATVSSYGGAPIHGFGFDNASDQ